MREREHNQDRANQGRITAIHSFTSNNGHSGIYRAHQLRHNGIDILENGQRDRGNFDKKSSGESRERAKYRNQVWTNRSQHEKHDLHNKHIGAPSIYKHNLLPIPSPLFLPHPSTNAHALNTYRCPPHLQTEDMQL